MNISRIFIPADVPPAMHATFTENMQALTRNTNNIFIFSCDQKIEHLNDDFFGEHIAADALYPEHVFNIASQGSIGAMAVPLGFLTRYGTLFPHVNYIAKLNGKTNVTPLIVKDALSTPLWTVEDVLHCKTSSQLLIRGIGVTVYIGSMDEEKMLTQAAHAIHHAHTHGLVAIVWMYARGKELSDEKAHSLYAGLCGLANALGADIVKIKVPEKKDDGSIMLPQTLRIATAAAGNTAVICAGGEQQDVQPFLQKLELQIQEGKTQGCAIGRTIFQKSLPEALALTHAISAIVYRTKNAEQAWAEYQQKLTHYLQQMHT